jgi:hypothetical protein
MRRHEAADHGTPTAAATWPATSPSRIPVLISLVLASPAVAARDLHAECASTELLPIEGVTQ